VPALSREARIGLALGLAIGLLGVLLALPTLSPGYRVLTTVSQGAWPNIVVNLVPLGLLLVIGGVACRRGLRGGWTAMFAGGVYGLMQGLTLYLIAVLDGDKPGLARAVWRAYVAAGYATGPGRRALVVAPILHPSLGAYLLELPAQMVVLGLIFGTAGAWLVRRRATPRDTPSAHQTPDAAPPE
jgi:hypothetical protein